MEKAAAAAVSSIESAVKVQGEAVFQSSHKKMSSLIDALVGAETNKLKHQISQYAEKLQSNFTSTSTSSSSAPGISRTRVAAGLAVVAIAALSIGAYCFGRPV